LETTEKIVESYCRYIKRWFTIPNIKCEGQYEIDLLAVDTSNPRSIDYYHIECGVSISAGFRKLTAKTFSKDELKQRLKQATQRRTIGYFIERKFEVPQVKQEIKKYGLNEDKYQRVIVSWGWKPEVEQIAKENNVILWDFRNIICEIAEANIDKNVYFTDDTARTIQLYAKAKKQLPKD
jgi:hypothetical protein